MSNLKTVGDCLLLCKLAGVPVKATDYNLFEISGAIEGFLDQISQLKAVIKDREEELNLERELRLYD